MGLDMYLYLRKYEGLGRWDNNMEQRKAGFYPEELEGFVEEIAELNFMSKTTTCQVGYWRKANAIHNWFVRNCADGVDDCRPIYVGVSKAEELLDICEQILADHSKAEELLPTQSGVFFGSVDYGEWYFEELEYTANLLRKVIDFINGHSFMVDCSWSIIYEASW